MVATPNELKFLNQFLKATNRSIGHGWLILDTRELHHSCIEYQTPLVGEGDNKH